MATLEAIEKSWNEDSRIDTTQLIKESADVPYLHNKYFKQYNIEKSKLEQLRSLRDRVHCFLFEHYTTSQTDSIELNALNEILKLNIGLEDFTKLVLKADVNIYIKAHEMMIAANLKFVDQEIKVEFLKDIIKNINNRSFNISNTLAAIKWSQGG